MVKVPATEAGIAAIEELTAEGVNVNVTRLFTATGTSRRHAPTSAASGGARATGEPFARVRSVASVFASRLDAIVGQRLGDDPARGSAAIANARAIHRRTMALFNEPQ